MEIPQTVSALSSGNPTRQARRFIHPRLDAAGRRPCDRPAEVKRAHLLDVALREPPAVLRGQVRCEPFGKPLPVDSPCLAALLVLDDLEADRPVRRCEDAVD